MSPLVTSLWITLFGMGLVFIAILLLWGLMEALMRITARFSAEKGSENKEDKEQAVKESEVPSPTPGSDQKKRAAIAAVAIALSLQHPASRPAMPSTSGSAWQVVTRANQLNQSAHVTRKSRGSMR
jgi:sodium pump decarboxylase gamma subunit